MKRVGGGSGTGARQRLLRLGRRSHHLGGSRNSRANLPLIVLVVALVATIGLSVRSDQSNHAASLVISPNAGTAKLSGMIMPTASSYIPDAPVLQPEGWTATASSHAVGHPAAAVLSGAPDGYWQSRPAAALPQSITIDMGGAQEVSALSYEPRHGAGPQGAIGRFEVTVSTDGKHFGPPIATGTWQNTTAVKTIGFAPVTVRWVRLTALDFAAGSGSAVTASSLTLYGVPQEEAPQDATSAKNISTNPGVVGQWGATIGFPLVPVAAAMLPDNQLLTWSADSDESFAPQGTANWTQTAILNLNTGVVTQLTVSNTDQNMFCPGIAILPNGEIIVAGGDTQDATSIYNPATDSWSKASPLNIPRGYNGMTLLSNGQAFTLGGSWAGGIGGKTAEVWSSTAGWRELPGVPETSIETQVNSLEGDSYGWFIPTSNGEVFDAGPSSEMHWITTTGAGSITAAGPRGSAGTEMEGNAVYYNTDQILTLGGSAVFSGSTATDDPATKAAYEINIAGGTAQVT
ncbi:MAG: discoidin domain-containing protein, partial [Acidimicrobiales bacterium]